MGFKDAGTRVNAVDVRRTMHPNTVEALAKSRPRRRGVEEDYAYYDPPGFIYKLITRPGWDYSFTRPETSARYAARDRAALCILYLGALRVEELTRGTVGAKDHRFDKLSILSTQFMEEDAEWLRLRGVINLKHGAPESLEDYPRRVELLFPRIGGLAPFTQLIQDYLGIMRGLYPRKYMKPGVELFGVKRARLYQVANHTTGFGPHYLKAQGLKLVAYLVTNNMADLKKFSGHSSIDSLLKYLHTAKMNEAMLTYPDLVKETRVKRRG